MAGEQVTLILDPGSIDRIAERVAELLRAPVAATGTTFAEVAHAYLEQRVAEGASVRGVEEDRWVLRCTLEKLAHLRVDSIGGAEVLALRDDLVRQKQAHATINRVLRRLQTIFRYAAEKGHRVEPVLLSGGDLYRAPRLPREHYFRSEAA